MNEGTVRVVNQSDFVELIALDGKPKEGRVRVVFSDRSEDIGPVSLRVRNPAGKVVVERVLRDLPTRDSSLCPPVSVPVAEAGDYTIEIKPLNLLTHRGPTCDPWELDTTVRRVAQVIHHGGAALLRVA